MSFQQLSPTSVLVQPGEYFLGDPCYAVPDELWPDLLNSCECFDQPVGMVAGFQVVAFGTAYGDGSYRGNNGREYSVDSGLIGLVPVAMASKYPREQLERLGAFWPGGGVFQCERGVFSLGQVVIDTNDSDYDDEGEEYAKADAGDDE